MPRKALLSLALALGLPLSPTVAAQATASPVATPSRGASLAPSRTSTLREGEAAPSTPVLTAPPTDPLQAFDVLRQARYQEATLLLKGDASHNLLGTSQGKMREKEGLQARSFTQGFVVVNTTTQDREVAEAQLGLGKGTALFTVGAEDAVFVRTQR